MAIVAAVGFAATDYGYVRLIEMQGGAEPGSGVAFRIQLLLGLLAVAVAASGAIPYAAARTAALVTATAIGLGLGFLAAMSIGVALMLCGVIALASLVLWLAGNASRWDTVGAAAGLVLAAASLLGIFLPGPDRQSICHTRSGTEMGGSYGGFHSYTYRCENGKLVEYHEN